MNKRKLLKIAGIAVMTLVILFTCFHFWFIHRSVRLLEDFVAEQTAGKYRLKIKRLHYNYAHLLFRLDEPTLTCLDTTTTKDKYNVTARQVTINLKQLLPLVFRKQLRFDSVFVVQPRIEVLHQKEKDTTTTTSRSEVNISQDMFNTYSSLRNVLGLLQVDQFSIHQGAFSITNTRQPAQQHPLVIQGIDFTVKGLNIDPEAHLTYDPLAVTDSIGLLIRRQHVVFPDGRKSIAFKSFRFNSVAGSITLDSFQVISRNDTTANNFNVFADRLSLKKFRLVSHGGTDFTRIDSVFFTRPVAKLVLEAKTGGNKPDSATSVAATLRNVVQTITGNGAVNYIGVNDVQFNITTLSRDRESHFNFVQDKLEIGNVLLNKDSVLPVSIGSLRFGLKRYTNYFNDSAYCIQFDSIRIVNGQLALYNFQLQSTPRAPQLQRISIPVLMLTGFNWYRFFLQDRIAFDQIALYDPQITVTLPTGRKKAGEPSRRWQDLFSVEQVIMQKANIKVLFNKREYAQVKNLTMNARTGPWFRQPSFASALAMLQGTGATEMALLKDGWNIKVTGPQLSEAGVAVVPSLRIENRQKAIQAAATNLRMAGLQVNAAADQVQLQKLSWTQITAHIRLPEPGPSSSGTPPGPKPTVLIGQVAGGPLSVQLHNSRMRTSVDLDSLRTGRLAVKDGHLDTLEDLAVRGNQWAFENKRIHASGKNFHLVHQQPSRIMQVQLTTIPPGEAIAASIPEIRFTGDLLKAANQQVFFEQLRVLQPKATVTVTYPTAAERTNTRVAQDFPLVAIRKAEIVQPDIAFTRIGTNDTLRLHLADAYLSTGMSSSSNTFNLHDLSFQAKTLSLDRNDSLQAQLTAGGSLQLNVNRFSLYKEAPDQWKCQDAALTLLHAELKTKKDSSKADTVWMPSFTARHFSASETTVKNWRTLLFNQPALQLEHVSIHYRNRQNIFMVEDLNTVFGSNRISMASFLYHPQLAEAAFIKAYPYETDFIRAWTGRLEINDFDRQAFIQDSMIRIRHIRVDGLDFRDTRDKTPPFLADVIKPLPVSMVNKIPFALRIDSVTLHDARVTYKEVSEKTGNPGTIYFSQVQSRFLNLKNRNQSVKDTFQWHANAMMMDSMPFYLGIRAAYKDSLDKLQLTVRLRPTDLSLLNPFFAPLESIRFTSGKLDTLELVALANDYVAHGTMRFFYHDLHIDFISASDTARKGLFKSVISFLANRLVLKKKNEQRIGTVYFERIRDRSIFNYIVKMLLSGMKTSIGVQKSRKLEKEYEKTLAEKGWKPLEMQ